MIVSGLNQKLRSYRRCFPLELGKADEPDFRDSQENVATLLGNLTVWRCTALNLLPTHCMFKHWIPKMMCGLAPQLLWEYVSSACHVVRVVKDSRGGPEEGLRSFLSLWHCISIPVTFFCPLIVLAL